MLLYSLFDGTPPPPPPPRRRAECTGYEFTNTGTLSGSGDSDRYPPTGTFAAAAGIHRGCLDGPAGVDFDLYLYRWHPSSTSVVARGIRAPHRDEVVMYNGTAGNYRWVVQSYSGAGNYTFAHDRP